MIEKFVYLTSTSYSGSTLLAMILNAHTNIASVSELSAIDKIKKYEDYLCSCGDIIHTCDFWKNFDNLLSTKYPGKTIKTLKTAFIPRSKMYIDKLSLHIFRHMILNDIRDGLFSLLPSYRRYYTTLIEDYLRYAEIILDITRKEVFFDASKNPKRILPLFQRLNTRLKVIHLVRDGRGVLNSFIRYKPDIDPEKVIKKWVLTNRYIEHNLQKLPKKSTLVLSYRDMAIDTEATIYKIMNFIGEDFYESMLSFRKFEHHILGNTKMRTSSTNCISYDDSWKSSLSHKNIELFNKIGSAMNKKYGYYD